MGVSICIVLARTGGHDWSVIGEDGKVAASGHEEVLRTARKVSWEASCVAAHDQPASQPPAVDTREQMLQPAPDFGIPCHTLRWLGASQTLPRSAS